MIFSERKNIFSFGNNNSNNTRKSCPSKIKCFIKSHPFIFFGIIGGLIIIAVVAIAVCIALNSKKEEEEEINEELFIEEPKIFPLQENLQSEVMTIYEGLIKKNNGTFEAFCEYLALKGTHLNEEQKVYLAYYWVINNIVYDHKGLADGTVSYDPPNIFRKKTSVCSGYSRLFRELLLVMNYTKSKIKNIQGYSKGSGYSVFKPPVSNHEWNAVEINGKWCLIDTTWDAGTGYYLCTPPRCFVTDHLPDEHFNNSLQFLDNPITVEKFHEIIQGGEGFCKYNVEIIENKAVQNICGKGKVIIKYNDNLDDLDNYITLGGYNSFKYPSTYVSRIEKGFQIDISINEIGQYAFYIWLNNKVIGAMHFECNEEPKEKIYYPYTSSIFRNSDAKLISPFQGDLIKGQKYTFEIRTSIFDELELRQGYEKRLLNKNGNTFKEENIYIYKDNIYIFAGNNQLISFSGIGDDVEFPFLYSSDLKLALIQPIKETLTKGKEYRFEIKCETIEDIRIKLGSNIVSLDRKDKIYTKNFKIDPETTEKKLYITYWKKLSDDFSYDYYLFTFKLE